MKLIRDNKIVMNPFSICVRPETTKTPKIFQCLACAASVTVCLIYSNDEKSFINKDSISS